MKIAAHVIKFARYVAIDIAIMTVMGLFIGTVIGTLCYLMSLINLTLSSPEVHSNLHFIPLGTCIGLGSSLGLYAAMLWYNRKDYAALFQSMKRKTS